MKILVLSLFLIWAVLFVVGNAMATKIINDFNILEKDWHVLKLSFSRSYLRQRLKLIPEGAKKSKLGFAIKLLTLARVIMITFITSFFLLAAYIRYF